MNKNKYIYITCNYMVVIFLSFYIPVSAENNDGNQVNFKEGEFSIGDVYCSEEQNNSDWCADEIPHKVRLKSFSIDKSGIIFS